MERGESTRSPRPRRSPPPPRPAVGFGTIEVTVKHRSVCWDSVDSGDPQPHPGASVTLRPPSGGPRTATADANARARFENVPSGNYTVEATAPSYTTASTTGTLAAGGTASVTIEIELDTGPGVLICGRQHTPRPSNAPTISDLPAIFWHDSLMIWIREAAWLLFMLLMVVFLAIAIVNVALSLDLHPGVAGFCLPAVCFGVVAYLTTIIFGAIPGIIMMVLAGIAWLTLTALTIATAAGAPGLLPLDFVWFPVICGMWTSFFVFLPIRMSYRIEDDWAYLFLFPIPSVVVGLVLFLVMVYVPEPNLVQDAGLVALCTILCVVFCFVFGLIGGLTGHVFKNDGAVEPYTAHTPKMSLPYAGMRYCVQGNRGYFSHYESSNQERCYDFAVPPGTHVLAIEEGHVISFREDKDGSAFDGSGNKIANYIAVQHRDGSVAKYLHLLKGGISSINPVLVANSNTFTGEVYSSDVHVHAGQTLALAGSTGISRFAHIHLGLYGPGNRALGLEFKDADVQRHGGRCFTFRKYLSSNPDHGPISV